MAKKVKPRKTLVIFDCLGEDQIKFLLFKGDYRHLHGVYLNSSEEDEKKLDQLNKLLDYDEHGKSRAKTFTKFPVKVVSKGDCAVIVCGFLP